LEKNKTKERKKVCTFEMCFCVVSSSSWDRKKTQKLFFVHEMGVRIKGEAGEEISELSLVRTPA